jgi:hypothetical protein
MVEIRAFLALLLATTLTGSVTAAPPARDAHSRMVAKDSIGIDHIPQFDGPMTTIVGPDGRTWATWTYRASGEFDIAVSSRGVGDTTWSTPVFFGRRNGSDELDPAIVVDSQGAAYIAFATTNPKRVAVAVFAAGSNAWSEPVVVSGREAASSPALLLVGDRLVVAFRTSRGVGMVDLPIVGIGNQLDGIQDGPDGTDPLGAKDQGLVGGEPPVPAYSRTPSP